MSGKVENDYELKVKKEREKINKFSASLLEMLFYLGLSVYLSWSYQISYQNDVFSGANEAKLLGLALVIALGVISIFSVILISSTPFVALFLRITNNALFAPNDYSDTEIPNGPGPIGQQDETRTSRNEIVAEIRNHVERSAKMLSTAKNRPNALLFAGFTVAVGGLVFFVVTLPKFDEPLPSDVSLVSQYLWSAAFQVVPRLLMLIFIQVLAGFFLRQYRSSMEDLRYFETVLRSRESHLISYLIRNEINDKKSTLKFAEDITRADGIGILAKGQTTAALETLKHEANEMSDATSRLISMVDKLKQTAKPQSKAKNNISAADGTP